MGKIEKIIKKGSVEGQTTEVYPVTSTKAVYDENNKRLDNIITGLQESVYDVVYKNKLTPILQEIDLSGTDTDRKAKLDQFAVDWKALTGADTLNGAKFVGYSGEPDDFWGIFMYNSSIEGYSAIATSARPSTYQVFIFPTGTIVSNSLFYHLEPVIIRTGNTDSDMANNVAAIKEYVNNLTYLGVFTYLGYTIPVYLTGNNFCGYLICNNQNDRFALSGTVFSEGIVKSIVIDETGRYEEIVDITGTNPLNTTSDNMVDAINEVNTLAKSKGNGTITEVRMNGASKGTSGVVDLGTVLTEHQDISGKQDKTDNTLATTDKTVIGAINEINTKVGNLTGALTWKGKLDTLPAVTDYEAGNVVSVGNKEYVLTVTGNTKAWEELGDEGSYLLKSAAEETYAKKTDIPTIPAIPTVNNPKVSIKMNGTEKGSFTLNQASAGEVDLGTVITAHQDISGKQDKLISGTNIKTINGESVIGSGDITINSAYPKVVHGTNDTTFTLTPNTFHVWDKVTSLTLNFGNETSGVANEYLFQFTSGSTATSLTLPDDIKWANNSTPTIVRKKIYQVSVLNGLASILEFSDTFNVNNYLTIEALEDNLTATFTNDVEYAIDGDEWVKLASGSKTQPINVGQTLSFRGEFTPSPSNGIGTFTINKKCNLKGNCMSMLFGDNAADNYSLSGKDYAFSNLFNNCKNIVNISSNFLPATTLADSCYSQMFANCTSLTTTPTLPSTILADSCYSNMFQGCTKLTTAPALPAINLAMGCYAGMFNGCTSLTTAPTLPAKVLMVACYQGMFIGCTSLTTAPALPATTLKRDCYNAMFSDCRSLITAPELPATTLILFCYDSMFAGCTSLTTAPELPANTLVGGCYSNMFQNCASLNYIKCLAKDVSATGCTSEWVSGVASNGTFVKNPDMDEWEIGVNGIPVNWTVEGHADFSTKPLTFNILSAGTINWTASDASITKTIEYKLNGGEWVSIASNIGSSAPTINVVEGDKVQFRGSNTQYATSYSNYNSFSGSTALFKAEGNIMSLIYGDDFKNKLTISSTYAFARLFINCTKLVSAENLILPATTLAECCYNSMFSGCKSLTAAPVLPATSLTDYCYAGMFVGCTSLTTVPSNLLPAITLTSSCYQGMFRNCSSLTVAPELPATILTDSCYQGMFDGCTKLNYIKCLATDIPADNCTSYWVSGVASTGTFVKSSSMTSWTTGDKGIPTGWTVQDA